MNMKILFSVAMAIVATSACSEVVKGVIGVGPCPSIEDVASAYERSEEIDLRKVAFEVAESQEEALKTISIVGKVFVELQALPGFKTLRKAVVGNNGEYVTEIKDEDPDCRVFCRYEAVGKKLAASAHVEWDDFKNCYFQLMQLRDDYVSVTGRCIDTNGNPVVNAVVQVGLTRTPVEQDERWYNKKEFGRTDTNGVWRVDGIETPMFDRTIMRICNTNIVNRYDSKVPPYGINIAAFPDYDNYMLLGTAEVPNIPARDRAAAERIFAAYKRKTGKEWPRPAPMTDFPVSTNNVIYVPDIVLKRTGCKQGIHLHSTKKSQHSRSADSDSLFSAADRET